MPQRSTMPGILAITICLVISACTILRPNQPPSLSPAQMREDLVFLRDTWVALDKSFSPAELQSFNSIIQESLEKTDTLTPAEFALAVARAVAVSGNGHTNANITQYLNSVPFRASWFSDGLYIVESEPEHKDLLGFRIDRIGNSSAEEALSKIAVFIPGTKEHIRFLSPNHLVSLESLFYTGITDSVDEAKFGLISRTGESKTITLSKQKSGRRSVGSFRTIPSPIDTKNRWPHVLDNQPTVPPVFRTPEVDVSTEWMADKTVLYIRSNSILSSDDVSLHDKFISAAFQASRERTIQSIIVDLRFNNGGDFFNSIVFSQILPHLVPDGGHVFVLIGNGTFSAALVTAAMLKGNGGDKVLFIGESMGDSPQFWSEGRPVPLPHSRIGARPAHGFHDWSNGCAELPECYLPTVIYAKKGISLEPDVSVPMTFENYISGHDSALETALSLSRTN